jgi:hypothetical protein
VLIPGQAEVIVPQGDLQIKNAALPDELRHETARTSVKLTYQSLADDEEDEDDEDEDEDSPPNLGSAVTTVLCSLTPGKVRVPPLSDTPEDASDMLARSSSRRVKSSSSRIQSTSSRPSAKSERETRVACRHMTDGASFSFSTVRSICMATTLVWCDTSSFHAFLTRSVH